MAAAFCVDSRPGLGTSCKKDGGNGVMFEEDFGSVQRWMGLAAEAVNARRLVSQSHLIR